MLAGPQPTFGSRATAARSSTPWRRLLHHPLVWSGLGILLFLLLFAFVAPVFYHKDVNTVNVAQMLMPPSRAYPLGTDALGENELGQLMIGGQVPIWTGFLSAFAATVLGVAVGIAGGLGGRLLDSVMMRLADGVLGVPQVVAILLIESIFGIHIGLLVLIFVLTAWPLTARVMRAETLALRVTPFIEAARAEGSQPWRILLRHVLPNLFDALVATFQTQFTNAVLVLAIASFVGAGMGAPWNWGSMIYENQDALLAGQWWLIVLPGLLFALLVVSVYLIGEGLRAAFNPQAELHGREAAS